MNTERKVTIIEPIQQKIVAAETAAAIRLSVRETERIEPKRNALRSVFSPRS